jgi:hypothetical protein
MRYLFSNSHERIDGTVAIPASLVQRWKRQMETPYKELGETEQESDRAEANQMLAIIRVYLEAE